MIYPLVQNMPMELLLEGSGRRRALIFIPISYNINKLWPVKILMKNGKLPPLLGPKWDKVSNTKCRKLLILGNLH